MKLKKLNEMSLITDDNLGISMEYEFKQSFKKLKLLSNDVELLGNKIYEDNFIFYFADKDDNYLGHIEYENLNNDKEKIKITATYAIKSGIGLYQFMFKTILAKTNIRMIFGDIRQSGKAIGAWKKQLLKFKKKIFNTETKQIEDFDDSKENDYWTRDDDKSKKYLVGLSESDNYVKRNFDDANRWLNWQESIGRMTIPNNDVLVRYYGFNNDEALSLEESCNMPKFRKFEEGFVPKIDESNQRLNKK